MYNIYWCRLGQNQGRRTSVQNPSAAYLIPNGLIEGIILKLSPYKCSSTSVSTREILEIVVVSLRIYYSVFGRQNPS